MFTGGTIWISTHLCATTMDHPPPPHTTRLLPAATSRPPHRKARPNVGVQLQGSAFRSAERPLEMAVVVKNRLTPKWLALANGNTD